jgi:broad-specificity NMP kinase
MTVTGKEGYTLKADGEVADYFIEMFGQTYTAKKLSDNVWAYSTPAHPQELAAYGLSNVVSGEHVMVKVQTNENGTLTHRISRVTTVSWKDAEGKLRWIHYTSLRGFHRRGVTKE